MSKYAVIGNPIKHSLSPKIHQAFAKQTGIAMEYIAIEAPLDQFSAVIKDFYAAGGKGCNITLPFKTQAFALADKTSIHANLAQAVNCLSFQDDGLIRGDNFDGIGFIKDLTHHHHFNPCQKRILILGAGGAAKGILGPLLEKMPSEVVIANRTPEKAAALAKYFSKKGDAHGVALADLDKITEPFDLIIHATSLGHKHHIFPVSAHVIAEDTLCYDLSYGEMAQAFILWAKQHKAKSYLDGLGMLIEQAAASFHWWHGVYPDTKPFIQGNSFR